MQLEGILTWEAVDNACNVIQLPKMANSLLHHTTSQIYHPLSLYLAKRSVYGIQQGPHMTNAQLVKKLKTRVEVVQDIGGGIGTDSKLVEDELAKYIKEIVVDLADATPAQNVEAKRSAQKRYLAVILLCAVDRGRARG